MNCHGEERAVSTVTLLERLRHREAMVFGGDPMLCEAANTIERAESLADAVDKHLKSLGHGEWKRLREIDEALIAFRATTDPMKANHDSLDIRRP